MNVLVAVHFFNWDFSCLSDLEMLWSLAAFSDLPWRYSSCNCSICRHMTGAAKCLVIRSAPFFSPGILCKGTTFLAHCSWSHKTFTSIWRTFAMPCLSRMPLAAVASSSNLIPTSCPMSAHRVFSPSASQAPLTTPYSSDSAELFAMMAWVFDHAFMQCFPIVMQPPDVLLRARLHPAQSASVFTTISYCSP